MPRQKPPGPITHSRRQVAGAMLAAGLTLLLLSGDGLQRWATSLPDSSTNQAIAQLARTINQINHGLGLTEPRSVLQSWSLQLIPQSEEADLLAAQAGDLSHQDSWLPWVTLGPQPPITDSDDTPTLPGIVTQKQALLLGDSLMQSIGKTFQGALTRSLGSSSKVQLHSKVSSGLARPGFYNWPEQIRQQYDQQTFHEILVYMGANDGQNMLVDGKVMKFASSDWHHIYQQRLLGFMKQLCSIGERVRWIALPPMRSRRYQGRIKRLNSSIATASRSSCVEFIDPNSVLTDTQNRYLAHRSIEGEHKRIRSSDGVHFTRAGSQLLSDHLIGKMRLTISQAAGNILPPGNINPRK